MKEQIQTPNKAVFRLYNVPDGLEDIPKNRIYLSEWDNNLVVYEFATISANLVAGSGINYRVGGMYLEFENVASPGDTVTVPTFDRSRNVSYYNNLSSSPDRDYLRVDLSSATVSSSDTTDFPKGNSVLFSARSAGLVGVHGKTFSDSANSVIYGAALVSFVDGNDATQDLIYSAAYFSTATQQAKLASSQVGIEWELIYG